MHFDEILRQIGEFGCYQKRVYFLTVAPAVLVCFETISIIFTFYIPDHRCAIPGYDSDTFAVQNENHSLLLNQTIPMTNGKWDQCHVYSDVPDDDNLTRHLYDNASHVKGAGLSKCNRWVYDMSTFESTIATDLNIVCNRLKHRAPSNMISELGNIAGTLSLGLLADRFGRKVVVYVAGLGLIAGGIGIAFITDLVSLNICRFFMGMARSALFMNSLVIGIELVGPSKRTYGGMLIELMWCLGGFLLLFFAYFIRDWRYLEIALSIPSVGLLFYWWIIPESPRWLLSRGKKEEGLAILKRIAASNKTEMPELDEIEGVTEEKTHSFWRALWSREVMCREAFFTSFAFVGVMVYYGLTWNITNLNGDIFINYLIGVSLETLSYTACMFLMQRLGRKIVCVSSMLVAGLALCLSVLPVLLNWPGLVVVAMCMVGRSGICMAITASYVYGGELFPTVIRSSAVNVGISLSRLGGLISPFIADLSMTDQGQHSRTLPMLIMGTPALLMAAMTLWMPETHRANLPDTLLDLRHSARKTKRCPLLFHCSSHPPDDTELSTWKEGTTGEATKA